MTKENILSCTYRQTVLPSDLRAVRSIVASVGNFSQQEIDIAGELIKERLRHGTKSGYFFLFAIYNKKVIGYTCFGPISCTDNRFDLYWIAVHKEHHNKGLGARLLHKSEQNMLKRNAKRIYIETSSREDYDATRAFYQKNGYTSVATLKDFYASGDSKVIFVKSFDTLI